jgi:hypothetical protein
MENQELLLLELEGRLFKKKQLNRTFNLLIIEFDRSNQIDKPISQNLFNFIEYVAKTCVRI